jgi:hypothetical protein
MADQLGMFAPVWRRHALSVTKHRHGWKRQPAVSRFAKRRHLQHSALPPLSQHDGILPRCLLVRRTCTGFAKQRCLLVRQSFGVRPLLQQHLSLVCWWTGLKQCTKSRMQFGPQRIRLQVQFWAGTTVARKCVGEHLRLSRILLGAGSCSSAVSYNALSVPPGFQHHRDSQLHRIIQERGGPAHWCAAQPHRHQRHS